MDLTRQLYKYNNHYQSHICNIIPSWIKTHGELFIESSNGNDDIWLMLSVDSEIIEYYRSILHTNGIQLDSLKNGSHMSIIRGKWDFAKPKQLDIVSGTILSFEYGNFGTNGTHWWIEVKSKDIENMRMKMGLKAKPDFDFHITLGRVSNVNGFKVKHK